MSSESRVAAVARQFEIGGEFLRAEPFGSGHINDTYKLIFREGDEPRRYLLQRINDRVFKDPAALMENIQRVTAHLAAQVAHEPDRDRRALSLIAAHDGRTWCEDDEGNPWRVYRFIDDARSCDAVESTEQAFQAARAFGQFQQMLASLPAPRLHDTIPDFHHTPKRLLALEQAIEADVAGRAILVKPEIEFALARQPIAGVLIEANLPERVTHNDTKFNNVLLDETTGEAICVVDLDTVMPGLAPCDFGDLVRSATSPSMEDEPDLSKVEMRFPFFEALVRGYLSAAGGFLTKAEIDLLATSGKVITYELGLRFLTDYLMGDIYFKVHRDGHNLDRCRMQFKLVESIERQEEKMSRLVESLAS
jgi:hypothetical protein